MTKMSVALRSMNFRPPVLSFVGLEVRYSLHPAKRPLSASCEMSAMKLPRKVGGFDESMPMLKNARGMEGQNESGHQVPQETNIWV